MELFVSDGGGLGDEEGGGWVLGIWGYWYAVCCYFVMCYYVDPKSANSESIQKDINLYKNTNI